MFVSSVLTVSGVALFLVWRLLVRRLLVRVGSFAA
jgi:hypothetical protein